MSEQEYFNVADIFGENVFNDAVMQERLPKKVYKKLHEVMDEGKELDLETADVIAHEMKEWPLRRVQHTIHIGSSHLQALLLRSMIHLSLLQCQTEKYL